MRRRNLELVQTATAPSGNLVDADFSFRETDAIDFEEMASFGIPLIVDYGADTCIPCKEIAPVLEKANAAFQGKAFMGTAILLIGPDMFWLAL